MMEIFVDIETRGRFQISNLGNVIRRCHTDSRKRIWPDRVMKHHISTTGYPYVCLKGIKYYIHRLLAAYFIPNPENKKEVNHKNGVRTDFRLENLEWVTRTENQIHSWRELGRVATWQGKKGDLHHSAKRVNQYDCDGNLITQHGSLNQAAAAFKCHPESIGQAIRRKGGYYKGITWTYDV